MCELVDTCPYYKGLFEMPEEYRQRYCHCEYRWCGRYLRFIAVERERLTHFKGRLQQDEG